MFLVLNFIFSEIMIVERCISTNLLFFYLKEKCAPYWPNSSTSHQQQYGEITVTFDSEIDRGGYVITKLYISHGRVCNFIFN